MTDIQITVDEDVASFVKQAWQDLFNAEIIDSEDEFFDLGGTSLAAIKFITAVENKFGMEALSPEELYHDPQFQSVVRTISRNVAG